MFEEGKIPDATKRLKVTSSLASKKGEVTVTIKALSDFGKHDKCQYETNNGSCSFIGVEPDNVTSNTDNLNDSCDAKNKREIAEALLDLVWKEDKVTVTIEELRHLEK